MFRTLATAATLAAIAAAPAFAGTRGFSSDIDVRITTPVKIEVQLSEDLAHRAENLPQSIKDRNGSRGLRAGFSANGYYGEDELAELLEELREDLGDDFAKRGVAVSDTAPVTLRVTLEDVRNNRPTFRQLSAQPNLSLQSFGTGGAEISGELIGAAGERLGTMRYHWFDVGLDQFDVGAGVWSDTNRAIDRFARHASKAIS